MNLEILLKNTSEPEWLKNWRKLNLSQFYSQPFPKWKRTDISSLKIEDLDFSVREANFKNYKFKNGINLYDSRNRDGNIVNNDLFSFSDLSSAIINHPEFMQKLISESLVKGEEGKFQSLGNAMWRNGFFIHLKKGAKIKEPLWGRNISLSERTLISKTIIFAEEDSEFVYIEDFLSEEMDEKSLRISTFEIYLERNASCKLILLNRRKTKGWDFTFKKAMLKNGAHLSDVAVELGKSNLVGSTSVHLDEAHSQVELKSLFMGNNLQQYDLLYEIFHHQPNTKSSIFSRGIMEDRAKGVWRGLTHVEKGSFKSVVSQKAEILLMGKEAKADAIPSLRIDENDCSASHGVSVSPLNPEKLFYLESKGIENSRARALIGKGFLISLLKEDLFIDENNEIERIIEENFEIKDFI